MESMEEILGGKHWKEIIDSMGKRRKNTCTQSIQSLLDAGLDVNAFNKYGTTMLSYATECGNLEIARFLVKNGADADVANFDGKKPLHIAAQYLHKDILKYFLNLEIAADSYDSDNSTALHYVAAQSDTSSNSRESCQELVHILVDHNADINAVNRKGCTPILLAAQKSRKHIVDLFIKLGANLENRNQNGWSILHFACREGWSGIVRTLLEGRFDIDLNAITKYGRTPAIIAANSFHKDILKLLVESGADVKCKGLTIKLIHCVCKRGWLDIMQLLVRKGIDINAEDFEGDTPLLWAANHSNVSGIDYLIECEADVKCCNKNGLTLLHVACFNGWFDTVKSLVRMGADINAKLCTGETPMLNAAHGFHSRIIDYLVECGADVKGRDVNGMTLLHVACFNGWFDTVKSIVSNGADINAKTSIGETSRIIDYLLECGADGKDRDVNGWTAIHYACVKGWFHTGTFLVSMGADINAKTSNGNTPVIVAANFSQTRVVDYLVDECGADLTVCGEEGWTLLHFICYSGTFERVKELVTKGWDINATTSTGVTPMLKAAYYSRARVIEYLIREGAYFQTEDYAAISEKDSLKNGILQNTQLCTLAVINKYNNCDLHKISEIPLVSQRFPRIQKLKIGLQHDVAKDIAERVEHEIKTNGFCNALNVNPIVLQRLCVLTLVKHCS